jgi:NitT/TauT family transport system permease protein
VVLQVTPIVAVAPLILIYVDEHHRGAAAVRLDRRLLPDPVEHGDRPARGRCQPARPVPLYRATPWQRLRLLRLPAALPYFVAGLKISGGLSLIGAVIAEFTAGTAGQESGLASRILEASFRLNETRMFAALALVSLTGPDLRRLQPAEPLAARTLA